jgi:acetoin utilization protein AcuB
VKQTAAKKKDPMTVADRMTLRPISVAPSEMLETAEKTMTAGHFRALPVVEKGRLVGILSDRDLLRFIGHQGEITVKEVRTRLVVTVKPETSLEEAARLLINHKIGAPPVTQRGRVIGIITSTDILIAYVGLAGTVHSDKTSVSEPALDF